MDKVIKLDKIRDTLISDEYKYKVNGIDFTARKDNDEFAIEFYSLDRPLCEFMYKDRFNLTSNIEEILIKAEKDFYEVVEDVEFYDTG